MFCPYCGKETSADYKFCQHCGKEQPSSSQPPQVQPPPQPSNNRPAQIQSQPQTEQNTNTTGKISRAPAASGKKRKNNLAVLILILVIIAVAGFMAWRFSLEHGKVNSASTNQTSTIPLSILNTNLDDVSVGNSIVMQLGALGGTPPYSWEVVSGNLPSGLNLDIATGRITGVPIQTGQSQITFSLTDKTGTSVSSNNLSWTVDVSPPNSTTTTSQGGSITQEQADFNALQNEKTAQRTEKIQAAQNYANFWPGLSWQGSRGPVWTDIDDIGMLGVTSIYFPIPGVFQNQSLYIMPMVQGDPLQLPWTFTATGLPKGITCDSSTGIIQGKLNATPVGTYKVEVYFKDATGNEASFGFPISVISSTPTLVPSGGGGNTGGGGLGTLSVYTSNNGSLYIDGIYYIGKGIAVKSLPSGEYTLTCEDSATGEVLWEQTIIIDSGKTTTVKVN